MSATTCRCKKSHVKQVRTSSISIFGEQSLWLAARPGMTYLSGHGWHYEDFEDALNHATGGTHNEQPQPA